MSTIETSRKKTFEVNWIWGPQKGKKKVMLEMEDARPLSEICKDFEGLDFVKEYKDKERTICQVFDGYGQLVSASRNDETGAVLLALAR